MRIRLSNEDLQTALELWVSDVFVGQSLATVKVKENVVDIEVKADGSSASSKQPSVTSVPSSLGAIQRGGREIGE